MSGEVNWSFCQLALTLPHVFALKSLQRDTTGNRDDFVGRILVLGIASDSGLQHRVHNPSAALKIRNRNRLISIHLFLTQHAVI